MTTIHAMAAAPDAVLPYRWTRAEYDRLVAAGVLDDMRVELIDGAIVDMTPQGDPHASVVEALTALFAPTVDRMRLRVQSPLAATDDSEPEPDVLLAPLPPDPGHPASGRLAVEVVVTRRAEARVKEPVYAKAGVDEYWIVDVPGRTVEVLTRPRDERYEQRRTLRARDPLSVPDLGVAFSVDELFARALLDSGA